MLLTNIEEVLLLGRWTAIARRGTNLDVSCAREISDTQRGFGTSEKLPRGFGSHAALWGGNGNPWVESYGHGSGSGRYELETCGTTWQVDSLGSKALLSFFIFCFWRVLPRSTLNCWFLWPKTLMENKGWKHNRKLDLNLWANFQLVFWGESLSC